MNTIERQCEAHLDVEETSQCERAARYAVTTRSSLGFHLDLYCEEHRAQGETSIPGAIYHVATRDMDEDRCPHACHGVGVVHPQHAEPIAHGPNCTACEEAGR